ncbi:excalibur calcium-binding domain-containing protein [Planktothrix agardhii]|jgi:hypothetical protein|uniref:excalibur calcium-binding domain-containing protein n=1 Tax=Planktothrix agardhii TaxID=1160 RepID=UPI00220D4F41|nr:excalibur calcium-binding domain-containing protein [Planktothrix agardhii]CAD5984140.1 hypothetical protein NO365_04379 [Planktothrix agardhii]
MTPLKITPSFHPRIPEIILSFILTVLMIFPTNAHSLSHSDLQRIDNRIVPIITPENTDLVSNNSPQSSPCHPSYPDICIPPPPPDLNCSDIPYRRFKVIGSDPHGLDRDQDGIGCEK